MAVGDSSDDLIPCLLGFGIAATVVGVCVVASVCRGAQQQQQNVRVIVSNHNTVLHIEYACVTIGNTDKCLFMFRNIWKNKKRITG